MDGRPGWVDADKAAGSKGWARRHKNTQAACLFDGRAHDQTRMHAHKSTHVCTKTYRHTFTLAPCLSHACGQRCLGAWAVHKNAPHGGSALSFCWLVQQIQQHNVHMQAQPAQLRSKMQAHAAYLLFCS